MKRILFSLVLFSFASAHAAPTFSSINESVLKPSCVGCHSGAEPKGNVDLSTYDKLLSSGSVVKFKPFESKLYLLVDSGDMPPEGPPVLQQYADDIYQWIKEGANDN